MTKNPSIYLEQINEAINIIQKYTSGMKKSAFIKPSPIQDAVILRLEIIGETARAVPEEFRNKHKSIPWRRMADFRNKLVHDYFGVDFNLVWNSLKKDLPKLQKQIKKLI